MAHATFRLKAQPWAILLHRCLSISLWPSTKKLVYTYHLQPLVWVCFKDDIFLIWQYSASELDTYVQYLNASHPSIKFTS